MYIGIDFGTTNSAIAACDESGTVSLVPLQDAPYWRTLLYFEPAGKLSAGAPAIARYLDTGGEGRLVQRRAAANQLAVQPRQRALFREKAGVPLCGFLTGVDFIDQKHARAVPPHVSRRAGRNIQ